MQRIGGSTSGPDSSDEWELRQPEQHSRHVTEKSKKRSPKQPKKWRRNAIYSLLLAIIGIGSWHYTRHHSSAPLAVETTTDDAPSNAVVTRVIDGDTFKVSVNGKQESVRVIGVDTPETVDPNRPIGCFGKEASNFTKGLLPAGTRVRLVRDIDERDKYGRLLAYVYRSSDNLFINAELARKGYAVILTIPPNIAHEKEFEQLADQARGANLGLWAACPHNDTSSTVAS